MKALRNSPVGTVWKILGNEGIEVVLYSCGFQFCGIGGLFPESQNMLGSHFKLLSILSHGTFLLMRVLSVVLS